MRGTGLFKNYTARDGMIDGSYLIGANACTRAMTAMNFGGWNDGLTTFDQRTFVTILYASGGHYHSDLKPKYSSKRSGESNRNAIALSELKISCSILPESIFFN